MGQGCLSCGPRVDLNNGAAAGPPRARDEGDKVRSTDITYLGSATRRRLLTATPGSLLWALAGGLGTGAQLVMSKIRLTGDEPNEAHAHALTCSTPSLDQSQTPCGKTARSRYTWRAGDAASGLFAAPV